MLLVGTMDELAKFDAHRQRSGPALQTSPIPRLGPLAARERSRAKMLFSVAVSLYSGALLALR